eukprot:8982986-Alexandrium_andersonii.AAC.1
MGFAQASAGTPLPHACLQRHIPLRTPVVHLLGMLLEHLRGLQLVAAQVAPPANPVCIIVFAGQLVSVGGKAGQGHLLRLLGGDSPLGLVLALLSARRGRGGGRRLSSSGPSKGLGCSSVCAGGSRDHHS